jgi:serine/threonine protein kinase/tetratricopeptide (TPR) repeat protein
MIGTLLNNRYRLDVELGHGGMGTVYQAHDMLLDRDVAVKVLSSQALGAEGRARLLHEAQAVARLNHPNIVKVYDAGTSEGLSFIVMERLTGDSLFDTRPKEIDAILAIVRQICAALEHAHAHGIIHRDLKLENVIMSESGVATLTDFGLARSDASRISMEGMIVGTVFYLAPEQALGQPMDGRADLYALGVILYELIAARVPFTGDDPLTIIAQHLHAPVVPPSTYNAAVPPWLDGLILKLLSKRPEDRPDSASEVLRILESEDHGETPEVQTSILDRLVRGRLVGREHESDEARGVWRQVIVAPGERPVLLISGESGVGKTPLMREVTTLAEVSGSKVLLTQCYDQGGAPYAPIMELIRRAVLPYNPDLVDGSVLADLLVLTPDLRTQMPQVPAHLPTDPQSEQQRLYESFTALCAALTQRTPLLIVVEDVHWSDSSTLFLLRHLARRARTLKLKLLLLLTFRDEDLDEACCLNDVLLDFNRERLATRIKLARFTREQTRNLLAYMLQEEPAAEFVDGIYRVTEGNLFYVEEVCRSLIEEGKLTRENGRWRHPRMDEIHIPETIQATIQARVNKLPVQVQDVLRLAAVIGSEFDFTILQKASEQDEEILIDAIEIAERAQIIEEVKAKTTLTSGEAFTFAHTLIPTALHESVSGLRRHRMHRRVAAAIEEIHPDDSTQFEVLAFHYEKAGDIARARNYYTQAGDQAMAVFANQEAERDYRAAIQLSPSDSERAGLLSSLGETLFRQSLYPDAIQTWEAAIYLYHTCNDNDNVARLYARLGRAVWYANDTPRSLTTCLEGLETVREMTPDPQETPGMAALLHETARAYRFNNKHEEALPLCEQALAMAQRLGLADVQAESLATLGILPNRTLEARRESLIAAIDLAEKAGLLATAARAHLNLGGYLQEMGEMPAALQHVQQARVLAHHIGITSWEHSFASAVVEFSAEMGDLVRAEQTLADMRQLETSLPDPAPAALITNILHAQLCRARGDWDTAMSLYQQYIEQALQQADSKLVASLQLTQAEILLESENFEAAGKILQEVAGKFTEVLPVEKLGLLLMMCFLNVGLGQLEQARRQVEEIVSIVENNPTPRNLAMRAWAEAQQAVAEKRWEAAFSAYETLYTNVSHVGMRWHQARIREEWARALALRNEPGDLPRAREMMREAITLFEQMNAPQYATRLREKLRKMVG